MVLGRGHAALPRRSVSYLPNLAMEKDWPYCSLSSHASLVGCQCCGLCCVQLSAIGDAHQIVSLKCEMPCSKTTLMTLLYVITGLKC